MDQERIHPGVTRVLYFLAPHPGIRTDLAGGDEPRNPLFAGKFIKRHAGIRCRDDANASDQSGDGAVWSASCLFRYSPRFV